MITPTTEVMARDVLAVEAFKPPGYVAEIECSAIKKTTVMIDGVAQEMWHIPTEIYSRLRAKYGGGGKCPSCGG